MSEYRYTIIETLPLKPGASGAEFSRAFHQLSTLDGYAREYGVSPTEEIGIFRALTDPQKVKIVYRAEDMEMLWQFYQDVNVHTAIKQVFDRFVDRTQVELEYWQEL